MLAVFSLFALLPLCLSAQERTARETLEYFTSEVDSFGATFSQEVRNEQGGGSRTSSGSVKLLRPGRFRWQYDEPYEQLILADGRRLWIYDKDLEQVTVKPQNQALASAPIMLLSGQRPLDADFDIVDQGTRDGLNWVELKPRVQDTEFERVLIGLDDTSIRRMTLHDQFSQQTSIEFRDVVLNAGIPESAFTFTPPAGVDVIGDPE